MPQQQQPGSAAPPVMPPMGENLQGFKWFAYMRNHHPVLLERQDNLWNVFRYDDVFQVITDHHTFSSENVPTFSSNIFLRETIVSQDPPNHRRLRHLINQAFTKNAIARMTDRISQATQMRLDQLLPQGKMEFIADLAFPLTTTLIALLLEIPEEDWHLVYRWVKGGATGAPVHSYEEIIQAHNRTAQEMYDYCSRLLAQRRREPREGLITALSDARNNEDSLSDDELLKFCVLLLVAGQETMQHLLTNTIYCLTTYPAALDQLIQQPALLPSTIEEVLRYLPPFWMTVRRTKVNTMLAGQPIPANAIVLAWNASANRDRAYFSHPGRFDIQRNPNHHLSFGHGIHFCLGAPLARLEASIILPLLLTQLKHMRRVPNTSINMGVGPIHKLKALPILFDP